MIVEESECIHALARVQMRWTMSRSWRQRREGDAGRATAKHLDARGAAAIVMASAGSVHTRGRRDAGSGQNTERTMMGLLRRGSRLGRKRRTRRAAAIRDPRATGLRTAATRRA
jgi:hypothetical protein